MDFVMTIKLAKDNVFDLYINDEWVVSRGHYENILDEAVNELKAELYETFIRSDNNGK